MPVGIGSISTMADEARASLESSPPELAVHPTTVTPQMTAEPDDPAWGSATQIRSLRLSPGVQAAGLEAVRTRVLLLWDADFLYVRYICQDDHLYAPHDTTHDAPHHEGDVVEVFLDPVGDGRQWYEIQVNPTGGVMDKVAIITGEPSSRPDGVLDHQSFRQMWDFPEYDIAGLKTATNHVDGQWVADVAIPAEVICRRLASETLEPMSMRANFIRYERQPRDDGDATLMCMNWSPVLWGHPHCSPERMGVLRLMGRGEADAETDPSRDLDSTADRARVGSQTPQD
ncbi:MAG: carbohydrate-binding family 9-like protein [Phycisphaeraceae bacterium]